MASKPKFNNLIDKHVHDPELKQLLLNNPDLLELASGVDGHFEEFEEQLLRYQERLRFNIKDIESSSKVKPQQVKSLTYQAYHDPLTGVPNRNYLLERTEAAILQAHRTSNPFALMFIDLDGFKSVNDSFGHDFGDMMLQLVANRLIETTRETDMVARLAGDEFCVLLMNMESAAQSARVANAIFKSFEKPVKLDGYEFKINMSIGISHYPMDGQTTKQLMKNADVAMYEAKKKGTNLFRFYEQRLTERVAERLEFEKDLSAAIEKQEFQLSLQPFINSNTGHIEAIDVGMQWHHPERGVVDSELFFHGITNSHILMPILQWQIEQCVALQQVWKMRGYPSAPMRVMVDHRQFLNKELFKYLSLGLGNTQTSDSDIELIISENTLNNRTDLAKRILVQAHRQGFKTGIQFQSQGFLPLETLQSCHLNSLTVRNSSVSNFAAENTRIKMVQGIKNLAEAINIKMLISDVNTREQNAFYQEQGFEIVSGNYFSESQTIEQFEHVLERFRDSQISNAVYEPISSVS